jgi:hypothetical protein
MLAVCFFVFAEIKRPAHSLLTVVEIVEKTISKRKQKYPMIMKAKTMLRLTHKSQ